MPEPPEDLKQFIKANVETVNHLRILLLLREASQRQWGVDDVRRRFHLTAKEAGGYLGSLAERGLLALSGQPNGAYRYAPSTVEQGVLVDRLAQLDRERPVTLIKLIYAKSRPEP
jgi:hypothetical protein